MIYSEIFLFERDGGENQISLSGGGGVCLTDGCRYPWRSHKISKPGLWNHGTIKFVGTSGKNYSSSVQIKMFKMNL